MLVGTALAAVGRVLFHRFARSALSHPPSAAVVSCRRPAKGRSGVADPRNIYVSVLASLAFAAALLVAFPIANSASIQAYVGPYLPSSEILALLVVAAYAAIRAASP